MTPDEYDAWYETPRGRWIGEREYSCARRLLAPVSGDSLLDVGCGTGWFTRRFAGEGWPVVGVDPDESALSFARARQGPNERYLSGDARNLPFDDNAFDCVVSMAALCFIDNEQRALAEVIRVARRRFVVGWLNRNSLLYRAKGHGGEQGGYLGARWHDAAQLRTLVGGLSASNVTVRSVVFFPGGSRWARLAETLVPEKLPFGSMLILAGDKAIIQERSA